MFCILHFNCSVFCCCMFLVSDPSNSKSCSLLSYVIDVWLCTTATVYASNWMDYLTILIFIATKFCTVPWRVRTSITSKNNWSVFLFNVIQIVFLIVKPHMSNWWVQVITLMVHKGTCTDTGNIAGFKHLENFRWNRTWEQDSSRHQQVSSWFVSHHRLTAPFSSMIS